jgi:hypothetical protein
LATYWDLSFKKAGDFWTIFSMGKINKNPLCTPKLYFSHQNFVEICLPKKNIVYDLKCLVLVPGLIIGNPGW